MFPRTPFMRRAVASYVRAMEPSARAKRAERKIAREEESALAHAGAGKCAIKTAPTSQQPALSMPSRFGSLTVEPMPMDVAVAMPKNELEEVARHKQLQQLERDIKCKRQSESAAGAPPVKAAGEPEPQPLALPALTLSLILNEEPAPLTDHGEFVVFTQSAAMRLHYGFKLWVAKAHLNGLPFSAASPFAHWLHIHRMGYDRGTTQLEFLVAYSQHLKHWKFFFLPNHSVDVD